VEVCGFSIRSHKHLWYLANLPVPKSSSTSFLMLAASFFISSMTCSFLETISSNVDIFIFWWATSDKTHTNEHPVIHTHICVCVCSCGCVRLFVCVCVSHFAVLHKSDTHKHIHTHSYMHRHTYRSHFVVILKSDLRVCVCVSNLIY